MDVLTLLQINESYSREKHTRVSPYPRRRYADVGRHVQEKRKHKSKILRPQRSLLPSVHVPTFPQVPLGTNS